MIVFLHVAVALCGLACTALVCLWPSRNKLRATYVLLLLTLASGAYLVVSQPAHMVQACVIGLGYTGVIVGGASIARARLAKLTIKN